MYGELGGSMAYRDSAEDLASEARQILPLVAAGLGTGAIADRLECDRDDVRRHLADAIRALGARSVPDAIRIAVRRGLIEDPAD